MKIVKKGFGVFVVLAVMLIAVSAAWAGEEAKVNINTATAEELATLTRIGLKSAQKIIEYREAHGQFKHPEEIMNVKGVGKKVWEVNKNRIVVTSGPNTKSLTDKS